MIVVVLWVFLFLRWKNHLYITSFEWKIDWTQNPLHVRHKTLFNRIPLFVFFTLSLSVSLFFRFIRVWNVYSSKRKRDSDAFFLTYLEFRCNSYSNFRLKSDWSQHLVESINVIFTLYEMEINSFLFWFNTLLPWHSNYPLQRKHSSFAAISFIRYDSYDELLCAKFWQL